MGGNDGFLVFDTELDNSGFEAGSNKMLSAINRLTGAVESLGQNMTSSFQQVIPTLQQTATTLASLQERMGETATQAGKTGSGISASAEAGRQQTDAYAASMAKLQRQIDSAKAKLSEYYSQIEATKASTDAALRNASTDEQAAHLLEIEEQEIKNINAKYADKLKVLADLEAEYQRVASAAQQAAEAQNQSTSMNSTVGPQAAQNANLMGSAWSSLATRIKALPSAVASASTSLLRGLGGALRWVASHARTAAVSLGSHLANGLRTAATHAAVWAINSSWSPRSMMRPCSMTMMALEF